MNFDLTEEQTLLMTALDSLARPFESGVEAAYVLAGDPVEARLAEGGFFGLCSAGSETLLEAALMIERIARLPHSVEIGASLLAPLVGLDSLPRPFAFATGAPGKPVRFLDKARTLVFDDGRGVFTAPVSALKRSTVNSIFGYSYAKAERYDVPESRPLDIGLSRFHALWRLMLAAEIAGTSAAALELTTRYVKERQQFGQAIGAFQAIQHRLSECAVIIRSMKLLTWKAATSGQDDDAGLAVVFAQRNAGRVAYDMQQFHGAIGLTLEYPLHYWIQRLKALQGELGGAAAAAVSIKLVGNPNAEQGGSVRVG